MAVAQDSPRLLTAATVSTDQLLSFKPQLRDSSKSTYFFGHSNKLGRRVHLRERDRYWLWVALEASPRLPRINVSFPPIALAVHDVAFESCPDAVAVDPNGRLTIFLVQREDEDHARHATGWVNACEARTWHFEHLQREHFRIYQTYFENLSRLLQFCGPSHAVVDSKVCKQMLHELGMRRRMTVSALLGQVGTHQNIYGALAHLILTHAIFSDIGVRQFDQLTELSRFEPIGTDRGKEILPKILLPEILRPPTKSEEIRPI
ncbi:hypothetical protein [Roseateles sp.]|uniref:hypothetical protein n=1 Tax=Roseateles sp. TaxID=1971397 RepID=UPI0031D83A74